MTSFGDLFGQPIATLLIEESAALIKDSSGETPSIGSCVPAVIPLVCPASRIFYRDRHRKLGFSRRKVLRFFCDSCNSNPF